METALLEKLFLTASTQSATRTLIPSLIYGCAWKRDRTADLVHQALNAGFGGIDVAAQPRHYREDLAGEGIRRAIAGGRVKRENLFVQSKYTPISGQDPSNLPYDPKTSIPTQVHASITSSLKNLRTTQDLSGVNDSYIDCLVLHSPLPTFAETKEAWLACEEFVPHRIRNLGISNTTLPILRELWEVAHIKPAVVQNRFHRETSWEGPLRKFCRDKGIVFQSFWTLSANPSLIRARPTEFLSKAAGVSREVAFYCLVLGLKGTVILDGTQNHMQEDLEGLEKVKEWVKANNYEWENQMKLFRDLIKERAPEESAGKGLQ